MNTAQESTYLDLTVNTSDAAAVNSDTSAAGETVSLIFPDADRRHGSDFKLSLRFEAQYKD